MNMKRQSRKKIFFAAAVFVTAAAAVWAWTYRPRKTAEELLRVSVGRGDDQIGYLPSGMEHGSEGPSYFVVDGKDIYIVDGLNDRIQHYRNGKYENSIIITDLYSDSQLFIRDGILYFQEYGIGKFLMGCDEEGEPVLRAGMPEEKVYDIDALAAGDGWVLIATSELEPLDPAYLNKKRDSIVTFLRYAEGSWQEVDRETALKCGIYSQPGYNQPLRVQGQEPLEISALDQKHYSAGLIGRDRKGNLIMWVWEKSDHVQDSVRKYTADGSRELAHVKLEQVKRFFWPLSEIYVDEKGNVYRMLCRETEEGNFVTVERLILRKGTE